MPLGTPVSSPVSRAAGQARGGGMPAMPRMPGAGTGGNYTEQGQPRGPGPTGPSGPSGTSAPIPAAPRPVDPLVQWYQGVTAQNAAQLAQRENLFWVNAQNAGARRDLGVGELNANAGFDRRFLANDRARLDADVALMGAKDVNLADNFMLAQRRFNDQLGQNVERRGFTGRQFDLSQRGADEQFRSAVDAARFQMQRANRAQLSDATARGATLTPGFAADQAETRAAFDLTARDAREGRDRAIAGATLTRDVGMSDLAWADRANQRTYDGDTSNFKLAQQQQKRERSYLEQLGKDYGVRADQIEDALKRGAERLGLNWADTINALVSDMTTAGDNYLAANQAATIQLLQASQMGALANASANRVATAPTYRTGQTLPGNSPRGGGVAVDDMGRPLVVGSDGIPRGDASRVLTPDDFAPGTLM